MIWHLNIGEKMWYIESDHEETESGLFINIRYLVINNQMAYYKSTDHPQLTHRQVLHLPSDHQQRTTDPPTTNNQPPAKRQVFYQPTDHRLTNKSYIDLRITNSSTLLHWPTILWLTNLSHHWTNSFSKSFVTELVKLFIKWLIQKNVDKLQTWYLRIGI